MKQNLYPEERYEEEDECGRGHSMRKGKCVRCSYESFDEDHDPTYEGWSA